VKETPPLFYLTRKAIIFWAPNLIKGIHKMSVPKLYLIALVLPLVLVSAVFGLQHFVYRLLPLSFSHLACFTFGALITTLIKYFLSSRSVYGLEHARLNISLPPTSMWMNMGYWKVGSI
jgi:hypothetical protein